MSVPAEQLPVEPPYRPIGGRHTEYTPTLGEAIADAVSEGLSMPKVAKRFDLSSRTLFHWIRVHDAFARLYAQARKDAAYLLAEETIDIADDSKNDYTLDEETGKYIFNGEHVQRARLRWDARRWLASKYLPKVFGDKIDVEHSGSIDTGQRLDPQGVIDGLVSLANEQPITVEPLRALLEQALSRLPKPALEYDPATNERGRT